MGSSNFISQETQVWITMAWQHFPPKVNVKNFKKSYISNAVDENDDGTLWNESKEDGDIKKMKVLTVKMETVTLVGEGR